MVVAVPLVDVRAGFERVWMSGRSGDSSAYGMFSPSDSGWLAAATAAPARSAAVAPAVAGMKVELRSERSLSSSASVTVVRDIDPGGGGGEEWAGG